MPILTRHLAILLAVAFIACGLSACGSINERLGAGMADTIPHWPGTVKYDEFMKERERKRLEAAPAKKDEAKSDASSLEPVH
jgi:hypothetical protein